MSEFLDYLFGAASFVPHGYCLLWRPDLVALHAVSDFMIAAAYLAIPAAIMFFVRHRKDLAPEHIQVAALFTAFIVACAITHLSGLVTLWFPYYGLQGLIKAITAGISVITAVMLWPLLPRLLALPSPGAFASTRAQLAEEVGRRRDLVEELRRINLDLENRVAERTRELALVNQRFEVALTSSQITVLTQNRELVCEWVYNPPFGLTAEAMLGRTDSEYLPADVARQLTEAKRDAMARRQMVVTEAEVPAGDKGRSWHRIHITPAIGPDGAIEGVIAVKIDITDERRRAATLEHVTQALAEANARFDAALEGSNITMFRQDRDLRYTWMYNPPSGMQVEQFLGRTDMEALPETTHRQLAGPKQAVLDKGATERLEVQMKIGEDVRWFDVRLEPLFEASRVIGLMCVSIDITDQKSYQQQMKFVMRELTHRSKNLLAVVQGIARQTAQTVESLPVFVDRFGARLQALARAHDILVDESWRGASLEELINTQLGHVLEKTDERLDAAGPRVMLRPEAAQNVALALHELATNAAKYGALSNDDGKVEVRWRLDDTGDKPTFELTWRERGGPPVEEPRRKGFGRMMIERLVPRAIDGTSDLVFGADGMRWTLRFPKHFLTMADEAAA